MKEVIQIRCKNNKNIITAKNGSSLFDIFNISALDMEYRPTSAKVNNVVRGLDYCLYHNADVEFLDIRSASGLRTYTRSVFFVFCKAVHDLFPQKKVSINAPVSNGYYCDIQIGRKVTEKDIEAIRRRMAEIIDAKLPIVYHETTTEDAVEMFEKLNAPSKVSLLKSLGKLYTPFYEIEGYYDYFYGSMLRNTGDISLFGLEPYYNGALLQVPDRNNPSQLGKMIAQEKMFGIFEEFHHLQSMFNVDTVGSINCLIEKGMSSLLISTSEAFQEKSIGKAAEMIVKRKGVRLVLIAGPSSSGKTTTSKRLAISLLVNGITPLTISLDDYFVNRKDTPRDASGDYDYESIYAINLDLFNKQMNALFKGEKVSLPKYNFERGESIPNGGEEVQLAENQVVIIEGIHALNPKLTENIPDGQKFMIYASALTTLLLDDHNYIPTTDTRLLRRIVRDYKYRGSSAQDTIRRWPSVRAGEEKWIFPYQENADVMINTALIVELSAIRSQAEAILEQVPENVPEYSEAYRLLKFMKYIKPINENDIPANSLLREFLGGSIFSY